MMHQYPVRFLAVVILLFVTACQSISNENVNIYRISGEQLLHKDSQGNWQPAPDEFSEYSLPATFLITRQAGQGIARLDLADPALANGVNIQVRIDGQLLMAASLFDNWEFKDSLEVRVLEYRERELASSRIAIRVTTAFNPLSNGCDPDDVFYIDGLGNAVSRASPSEMDATSNAETRAGTEATRQRLSRESMLACNTGCVLTRGPDDYYFTPPQAWMSKKYHVRDASGTPVPAWWARTYFGWRAMYVCKP